MLENATETDQQHQEPIRTQARKLSKTPPLMTFTALDPIEPLQGLEDYGAWLNHVKLRLASAYLEDLINKSIPRPSEDSLECETWGVWSMRVRIWLASNISASVTRDMSTNVERPVYADDYLVKLYQTVHRFAYRFPHRAWEGAVFIERRNYKSVGQFVYALQTKVALSNKVGMPITPYMALRLLFKGVRVEMPGHVVAKEVSLPADPAMTMDDVLFDSICRDLVISARHRDL
ncbi:hypothetical protein BJX99DRAFT_196233 [Aspergillus californicus]